MIVTDKQVQIIHIAKHQLKIDDETYRDLLVSSYNVSSSKQLSSEQADELIALFKAKGFKQQKPKTNITRGGKIIKLASFYQIQFINNLKSQVVWHVENGFDLWLIKRMKIRRVVTSTDAQSVIEGLKAMIKLSGAKDE